MAAAIEVIARTDIRELRCIAREEELVVF